MWWDEPSGWSGSGLSSPGRPRVPIPFGPNAFYLEFDDELIIVSRHPLSLPPCPHQETYQDSSSRLTASPSGRFAAEKVPSPPPPRVPPPPADYHRLCPEPESPSPEASLTDGFTRSIEDHTVPLLSFLFANSELPFGGLFQSDRELLWKLQCLQRESPLLDSVSPLSSGSLAKRTIIRLVQETIAYIRDGGPSIPENPPGMPEQLLPVGNTAYLLNLE